MKDSLNQIDIGLFIWQVVLLSISILVLYFLVKLYKKASKYFNNKM